MKIGEWIVERILGARGGKNTEEGGTRLTAAPAGDAARDDLGWRKLTGDPNRKLPSVTQDRMIELSYWLWKNNPMANWIIEITTAFVVGDGVKIEAKHPDVQALLDAFWSNPINAMNIYLEKHTRELGIYGELCLPKFVSEHAGKVSVGFIDPAVIRDVLTDPENVKMVIGVFLKSSDGTVGKRLKTVIPPEAEAILSRRAREMRDSFDGGECYFFSINNVTNDPRGTSDLFVIADWLDAYEQFLFDYTDKWPLLNVFVWDLLVEGADEKTLVQELQKFTKKSGSVYAHNEKTTLDAKTPNLNAAEADTGARLIRNHILGNKSLPEHWFGGGGDVNRATAMEMGAPAYKMLSSRQKIILYIIKSILTDVIREADARDMLPGVPADEKRFNVFVPELSSKDISRFSAAIEQITASLAEAVKAGWIDRETSTKIFAFCLSLVGYEVDVETVKEKLREEAAAKVV